MTVVDYAPNIIARTLPQLGYPLTAPNVAGWLFFEGAMSGRLRKFRFASLLVTYLAATMPGRLRLGRFEMNWAGVIAAAIFRAAARGQLLDAGVACRAGSAGLCFCARRPLCVLAREIEERARADRWPQRQRRYGIRDSLLLDRVG